MRDNFFQRGVSPTEWRIVVEVVIKQVILHLLGHLVIDRLVAHHRRCRLVEHIRGIRGTINQFAV